MGADLYIRSLHDAANAKYGPLFEKAVKARDQIAARDDKEGHESEAYKKAQAKVSKYSRLIDSYGYFRDPYNRAAIMPLLGLGWGTDLASMLNKKNELSPTNAKKLAIRISLIKPDLSRNAILNLGIEIDDEENSVEGWQKYFLDRHKKLVKFLDQAVDLKEPILCSL